MKILNKYLSLILLILPLIATAADNSRPDNLEPLEDVPPPPKVQDGEVLEGEPQVTIRKRGAETVEEYRINGELYMVKVTPEHGVPYYMHKEDSNGAWLNDGPTRPLSVPKWIIFRF